ncbi:Acyl-CoA thioesterase [Candidatus Bealeia paramacronuclearis]|uniref:Acyl-CoA thioesterase n=1 Tax=Candidatus Bealeia paramacronuclearis TaxID=1921001 RepID=A0ABZ2C187_9PROT|nr:Acyl-CoA thioesterase [Candidatus Bealeia paramacronuclearis]
MKEKNSEKIPEVRPPAEKLSIRVIAMPGDTNPNGDMFGGWLLSLMDMAAGNVAVERAHGRVVTVAIDAIAFLRPVLVGDEVSCYAEILEVGTSSMKIDVQAWARRRESGDPHKVTEGVFTFVAIGPDRRPRPIPKM